MFQYPSSHSLQRMPTTPFLQGHCPVDLSQKQGLPRGQWVTSVPRRSHEHSVTQQGWTHAPGFMTENDEGFWYLCIPGPERCHSNQVCSLGSVAPWCCGGSGDILPLRRHRRYSRRGRCCCCRGTARSRHPEMPGCHSNRGCICHSLVLTESQWHSFYGQLGSILADGDEDGTRPIPSCPSLHAQVRPRDSGSW